MRCWICDEKEFHYRNDLYPKKEVGICKNCGNVQFKYEEGDKDKLKEFYRSDYRREPGVSNIITTTHKLNYIKIFLGEWLKDKSNLIVADVGAATGYLLDWFKRHGHRVTGTELTRTYRRFSEHYYGVPLTEELTPKHKYDLIVYYHVLEHMLEPDVELMEKRAMLSDNGHMLISVPEWFFVLENLAAIGNLSIDNYFHKNHVYACSRQSMHNLLAKCGLQIVKEDYVTYGQTYLVRKLKTGEPATSINPEDAGREIFKKEDWQKVNADIDKIKKAIGLFTKGKFKDAINTWYNFPDAHLRLIFDTYKKDTDRQKYELDILISKLGEVNRIVIAYATWLYQNQKYEECLEYFEKAINVAPHEDLFVFMGWALANLNRNKEAMNMFSMGMQVNPTKWTECIGWICRSACQMPSWDEKATEEIKNKMFEKVKPKIELKEVLVGGGEKKEPETP